jgi:hypothetical protein
MPLLFRFGGVDRMKTAVKFGAQRVLTNRGDECRKGEYETEISVGLTSLSRRLMSLHLDTYAP